MRPRPAMPRSERHAGNPAFPHVNETDVRTGSNRQRVVPRRPFFYFCPRHREKLTEYFRWRGERLLKRDLRAKSILKSILPRRAKRERILRPVTEASRAKGRE